MEKVKNNCFAKNDTEYQPIDTFKDCTNNIMNSLLTKDELNQMKECANP